MLQFDDRAKTSCPGCSQITSRVRHVQEYVSVPKQSQDCKMNRRVEWSSVVLTWSATHQIFIRQLSLDRSVSQIICHPQVTSSGCDACFSLDESAVTVLCPLIFVDQTHNSGGLTLWHHPAMRAMSLLWHCGGVRPFLATSQPELITTSALCRVLHHGMEHHITNTQIFT